MWWNDDLPPRDDTTDPAPQPSGSARDRNARSGEDPAPDLGPPGRGVPTGNHRLPGSGDSETMGNERTHALPAGAAIGRRIRERVYAAFFRPETGIYRIVQSVVWALILASVGLFIVDFSLGASYAGKSVVARLDRLILSLFAVEITLRILFYRPPDLDFFAFSPSARVRRHLVGRLYYILRPMTLVDILTVAALVPALRGLRALRLLRLLRSARLFRYSNPFHGLARSFRENSLLFALAFSFLLSAVLLGGISFFLIEGRTNPDMSSAWDGIWWALVTITTVGFGDISPQTGLGRTVGGVLMISGMFTLAFFAGVVGNTLLKSVLTIREEHFRMTGYIDHVVICGYEPGAGLLLEAIMKEIDVESTQLVVFAEGERPADLPPDLVWVNGDPTKESELDKVRMSHAAAAILVGLRAVLPQDADAKTLLTAFTIRSYMKSRSSAVRRRRELYVVAEILDVENVAHAYAAGADEVVETRRLGFSLLAHAVTMPGTAALIGQVATSSSHGMFIGELPDGDWSGRSYGDVRREIKSRFNVLVIGLRNPATNVDQLDPPDDAVIADDTQLIYLGEAVTLPLVGTGPRNGR